MSTSHPKSVVLWHLSGCIATFYSEGNKKVPLDTVSFTNKAYLAFRHVDILRIAGPAVPYLYSLCSLQIQNNQLKSLPKELWRLSNLRELNVGSNQLEVLPIEVGLLVNLTELFVHNNKLKEIPCQIGNLKQLKTLDVTNNQLIELPAEILKLELDQLWVDKNPFEMVQRKDTFLSLKGICLQTIGLTCLEDEESRKVIEEEMIEHEELLKTDRLLLPHCSNCQIELFHHELEYVKLQKDDLPYLYRTCNQNCFIQIKTSGD